MSGRVVEKLLRSMSQKTYKRELRTEATLGAFGTEKRPWRSIFATAVIFIFLKGRNTV